MIKIKKNGPIFLKKDRTCFKKCFVSKQIRELTFKKQSTTHGLGKNINKDMQKFSEITLQR